VSAADRLDDTSTLHQSVIAPSTVDWEATHAVINDDTYVRTFWIEQFPEEPADGIFERLLLETDLNTDISIHLDPSTVNRPNMMADWISDLKVNQHDSNSLKAEDLQKDIDRGSSCGRSSARTRRRSTVAASSSASLPRASRNSIPRRRVSAPSSRTPQRTAH